jgi:RHS repeat-associated protein
LYTRTATYNPDVVFFFESKEKNASASKNGKDYSTFGAIMPGRSFSSNSYRYGFNNQESDDEISGTKNSYSFEYRDYDPRLVRFKSVDPLSAKYPWNSPFAFAENSPIRYVDLEGLEKAEPEAFQAAQANIDYNVSNGGQSTYFPNITREEFGKQLTNLVSNPESPNLQEWFCGPTALAYTYLNYNPIAFTTAAFELYDKGTVSIPGGGTINASDYADVSGSNPDAVFQMFATSLRASQNSSGQLGSVSEQGTKPWDFVGMVNTLGLKIDQGGFFRPENIGSMNNAASQGKFTILLENYQVSHGALYASKSDPLKEKLLNVVGVHYITVTSSISVHGQNMRFQWWDHRGTHPSDPFNVYKGTEKNFRQGVKGWWTISR